MRRILICTLVLLLLPSLASALTVEQGVTVETGNASYLYNENISMDNLTVTSDCMIIEGGYINDSYCNNSDVVFDFPDLNISAYLNVSPEERNLTIQEGENLTLNVSEGAGGPLEWAKWFLNSAYEVASDTYTYVTTYASSETAPDNVTVYSRSEGDTLTSTNWRLNVENTNLAPTIDSFSVTPTVIDWGAGFTFTCDASDEDIPEENLSATIGYRLPGSNTWTTENATWNGADWELVVNTSLVNEHIGYWDGRCRVQDDKDEYSAYQTDYDAVYVNESIVQPTRPDSLAPSGTHDMYVPFECLGSTWYNNVSRLYDFDVNVNGTWLTIARNISGYSYQWYTGHLPSNTTLKGRCRAKNSAGTSEWRNATGNVTIRHRSTFNLFYDGMLTTLMPGDNVPMSIYASLGYDNMYLESAFVDCNDDEVNDYAFRLYNQTGRNTTVYRDTMHEQFTCTYSEPGTHTLRTGIFIERINESIRWQGKCGGLALQTERCLMERTHEVTIDDPITDDD